MFSQPHHPSPSTCLQEAELSCASAALLLKLRPSPEINLEAPIPKVHFGDWCITTFPFGCGILLIRQNAPAGTHSMFQFTPSGTLVQECGSGVVPRAPNAEMLSRVLKLLQSFDLQNGPREQFKERN